MPTLAQADPRHRKASRPATQRRADAVRFERIVVEPLMPVRLNTVTSRHLPRC
jgi:hypothetical protein